MNRAIGLGLMGFTDILEKFGIPYNSAQAFDLVDEIVENISYAAIEASIELAKERGAYPNFEGSRWSQGLVPVDSIDLTEENRQFPINVSRRSTLDWDKLREEVKGGIRNATLMAIAPTASIGLIAGTTPGFDPQFAQMFSRATSSGKFLEVNNNLVNDLKRLGLWEDLREEILRSQGDIQHIEAIPVDMKEVYRTSFQIEPEAFLHVAARAQKWVDQAISRNMYLETRDIEEMMRIYSLAWELGVKTTYYLHMKPRHTAEQSTTKVNKAEAISASSNTEKKGFGAAASGPKKSFGFGAK
jgi:ribonucleoside-diphosphate reductase alpha chain